MRGCSRLAGPSPSRLFGPFRPGALLIECDRVRPSQEIATPKKEKPPRAEVFIDGTNFDIAAQQLVGASIQIAACMRNLVGQLVPRHTLVKVRYCTAPTPWRNSAKARFQDGYFEQLRNTSVVDLILGRHELAGFDGRGNKVHAEKETDINVAINMLAGAYEDRYETAVIISGDTDMVPVMRMVRATGKRVVWGHFPAQTTLEDLRKVSDGQFVLSEKFLRPHKVLILRR